MAPLPERIVLATPRVAVGEWRCRRTHPDFADSGPIQRHLVAFPRTAVTIRHAGDEPFVADAGLATLYNRGQRYTREPVHPLGDFCDWWSVDSDTAAEIAASVDSRVGPGDERPMRFARAPVDAALYMRQRAVLMQLEAGDLDELAAEEAVLSIVHAAATLAAQEARAQRPRTTRSARDVAHGAARELAASWHERLTLDSLSQRLGVSPFHLCRSFRDVIGCTLHRQLTVLRLRASLEAVAERGNDLTLVALDHGFSSHSHFTAAFRREWGMTPSEWRMRGQAIFR